MHEEAFRAIAAGATVITASRRLARVLSAEFHSRQRSQGRAVWATPGILPLGAFLDRLWRDSLFCGVRAEYRALLDPYQEQLLWERVIRESPSGESLLRIPETSRRAMEAWQLVHDYRLPVDGRFEAGEDSAAFLAWSRAFREECRANKWLERARLSAFLAEALRAGELPRPAAVYLAGFDELTPVQADFFEALGETYELELPTCQSTPSGRKLRDNGGEILAAARWARQKLEQNPDAQVGVIVPDLSRQRARVERVFREELDPGAVFDDRERSFHVSLGPSLDEYPLVRAALLILEFGQGRLDVPQAGMLLRSPFLEASESEWTRRALLDTKLRDRGVWDVTVARLLDSTADCPTMQRALQRFEKARKELPEAQHPSEWRASFEKSLDALGWPGDRALSSREYQTVDAWRELLSSFAALDWIASPMTHAQALARLREIGRQKTFQVENEGAPVQVMGLLEASGLRFDHLWILGLHDEALPAPASPNPFLPASLQREFGLPHSSADRELRFAVALLERLLASSPDIALSYPETEGDRVLTPSPLLPVNSWLESGNESSAGEWIARMREGLRLEDLHDDVAPPVAEDTAQRGGHRIFRDMAVCPFRAFAVHRLGAKPLDETGIGLNYRDRGNGIHKALELVWTELGSHDRLVQSTPAELQALISRCVDAAIQHVGPRVGQALERRRLLKLLGEWLEIEKQRAPFTVTPPELERTVSIGGLRVRTRADRIDEIGDGRQIIFDYKTGQLSWNAWSGGRPDEPQLPLYCATSDRPVAGAAFVQIRTGEMNLRGLTAGGVSLPDLKKMKMDPPLPFDEQVPEWRRVLERLAIDFRAGRAVVDPKDGACEHCGQWSLCRVRESTDERR